MKRILASLLLTFAFVGPVVTPTPALAVSPQQQACTGAGGEWTGGQCRNEADQGGQLLDIISNIINTLLFMAGIVAVIMIIIGGFRFITANGDASKVSSGRSTVQYAVVGLVIVIASFAIVNFVLDQF